MSVATETYIRKPLYVEAVRITHENFDEIAAWCQGEIAQEEKPGKPAKPYIRIRVHNPKNPRQTMAFVGDWVLYTPKGYKIYTNRAFQELFDLVGPEETPVKQSEAVQKAFVNNEGPTYPYQEGDTIVIGPECFADPKIPVISWKGVNYVPATEPRSTEEIVQQMRIDLKPMEEIVVATGLTREEIEEILKPTHARAAESNEPVLGYDRDGKITDLRLQSVGPVVADPDPSNGVGEIRTVEDVPEQESIVPAAAEGKRVLSIQEQRELGREAVREMLQSGEVVLAQDIAQP